MAKLTKAEFVDKWSKNTKGAVTYYKQGVQSVQVNPAQQAAEASNKWQENVSSDRARNRFVDGLSQVTLQSWKNAAAEKGAARISSGVDGAVGKMGNFADYVVNTIYPMADDVNSMANTTFDDRVQKAISMMTGLHNNPYKG